MLNTLEYLKNPINIIFSIGSTILLGIICNVIYEKMKNKSFLKERILKFTGAESVGNPSNTKNLKNSPDPQSFRDSSTTLSISPNNIDLKAIVADLKKVITEKSIQENISETTSKQINQFIENESTKNVIYKIYGMNVLTNKENQSLYKLREEFLSLYSQHFDLQENKNLTILGSRIFEIFIEYFNNKNRIHENLLSNFYKEIYDYLLKEASENINNHNYEKAENICLEAYKYIKNDERAVRIYGHATLSKMCHSLEGEKKNVLVIGDVMLDNTLRGYKATPGEVAFHHKIENVYMLQGKDFESHTLGGAGYLGHAFSEISKKVILIGVIGEDCEGKIIEEICEGKRDTKGKIIKKKENRSNSVDYKSNNIKYDPIKDKNIITTTKIYFFENTKKDGEESEGVRFDREDKTIMRDYCIKHDDEIIEKFNSYITKEDIDCIVIDDYEKGLITDNLLNKIFQNSKNREKKVFVDPKNNWSKFTDFEIEAIIPNILECKNGLSFVPPGIASLKNYPNIKNFIIKAGKNGAFILNNNKNSDRVKGLLRKSSYISEVGCGCVFNAFFITSMLYGYSIKNSVLLANYAAGLRTTKHLGEIVTPKEILEDMVGETQYFKDNEDLIKDIMTSCLK